MHKTCIHDFHFLMDKRTKDKLKILNFSIKSSSLSGKIVKILEVLAPAIRKEHKWGEQRQSKYSAVCNNPEDIREDIHVYIPKNTTPPGNKNYQKPPSWLISINNTI